MDLPGAGSGGKGGRFPGSRSQDHHGSGIPGSGPCLSTVFGSPKNRGIRSQDSGWPGGLKPVGVSEHNVHQLPGVQQLHYRRVGRADRNRDRTGRSPRQKPGSHQGSLHERAALLQGSGQPFA